MGTCLDIGFVTLVPDLDGPFNPRAQALRVLLNAIAAEDFFENIGD
jgi:hypothetical protein